MRCVGRMFSARVQNTRSVPFRCGFHIKNNNNNNNTLYSSLRKIKAVVRSHNEEPISIILSH